MITYSQILDIAIQQSAYDSGCFAKDFLQGRDMVVLSKRNEKARKYLELPFVLDLTSYGSCIVASAGAGFTSVAHEYLSRFTGYRCFETPSLHVLSEKLRPLGADVCFMAEYWLPRPEKLTALSCGYELRILMPSDFESLYLPEWSNALCRDRRQLDMLCVGAYDKGQLIALAGASADCEDMWQIGIDVLPEYRKQGIAACLTSNLALQILERNKVPFYCCAWSNVASARNAIASGFVPAWVQVTAKKLSVIEKFNAT